MTEKVNRTAYVLLEKALRSDDPHIKDALETMLMITSLKEGNEGESELDQLYRAIAELRQQLNALQEHIRAKERGYRPYDGTTAPYDTPWGPHDQTKWADQREEYKKYILGKF